MYLDRCSKFMLVCNIILGDGYYAAITSHKNAQCRSIRRRRCLVGFICATIIVCVCICAVDVSSFPSSISDTRRLDQRGYTPILVNHLC